MRDCLGKKEQLEKSSEEIARKFEEARGERVPDVTYDDELISLIHQDLKCLSLHELGKVYKFVRATIANVDDDHPYRRMPGEGK